MHVLIDTGLILDLLLARNPFAKETRAIIHASGEERCVAFIIPAFAGRLGLNGYWRQEIRDVVAAVEICPIDGVVLQTALALPLNNLNAALHVASATIHGIDAIVTRNPKHYKGATLPLFSPADFLAQLQQ